MTRKVQFAENEFYHCYNRGVEKRRIFVTKKDYERFLSLLYICNSPIPVDLRTQGKTLQELVRIPQLENLVSVSTYCLMPNHFHLLLREIKGGGISKFMQKLLTAYTMYFNKRNNRTGALFQGIFQATHVDSDQYLKYLISYIHLNPIKLIQSDWKENGIKDMKQAEGYLEKYAYSSYLDFAGKERLENILINRESLPEYFGSPKDFESTTIEWLNYKPE